MSMLFQEPCVSKRYILLCSLLVIFYTTFLISDFAYAQSSDNIRTDKTIYITSGQSPVVVKISGSFNNQGSGSPVSLYIVHEGISQSERLHLENGKFSIEIKLDPKEKNILGHYKISAFYGGQNLVNTFEVRDESDKSPAPLPPQNILPSFDDFSIDTDSSSEITIKTDFPIYNTGDEVIVLVDVLVFTPPGFSVVFQILSPNNNIIEVAEIKPNNDGKVSKSFKTGKQFYNENGIYAVKVFYNSVPKIEAIATFEMVNPAPPPLTPPPPPPPTIHKKAFIEMSGFKNVFDFDLLKFQYKDSEIQFENNNGRTIHIYKDGKTIQDLFDSLNIGITAQCISDINSGGDFCSNSMHELKFSVNGKNVKILSDHVLEDGDIIKIEYKKLVTNPAPANPIPAPQPPPTIPNPQQPSSNIFDAGQPIDSIWIAILLIITGMITVIIVAVNRINKKPKKLKPKQSVTKQRKPRASPITSTILFYECPQCHDPDIHNNSDGTATCDACGFKN